MARLAITFAVLFFLFTFSGAHLQVFPTENDLTSQEDDSSKSILPADADNSNPTLLLPSDKPDVSDSAAADESASAEVEAVDVNDLVHVTLPESAAFVSFHPINRHFRMNRQFPLRYSRRRPCRHFVRPMNHHLSGDQISYGNDMILSNNENKGLDPELLFRDQVIPSMALRFQRENHHHHHHDHHHGRHHHNEFMSKYVFAREKLKRPFRCGEEERENEGRENGGLVKRFRKFLNHF